MEFEFMPKSKLMKSSMFRKIHSHILPFFVAFSIVIIIANLLTGCGTSPGNTDSGTTDNNESNIIGSAGGTVTSSNGKVKIVIPSGALNKDTEITFSAASNQPAGNIGTAYEVNPDGTTFNKPVTISIIYDEASLPAGVTESDIKLGTVTNNQWDVITDSFVNTTSNTISGSITHLSTYGIMAVNIGSVPAVPTGIAATAGDGKVTISWDAVSVATSYNIYWSTSSGVTKTTGAKIADVTTPYTHTGRTNGTTYYYVVTAVNIYGESGESVQVSAKPVKSDTTPPETSITDKPSSLSNLTSASFSFSSTETDSTFQCQIDNGGYSSCISPKVYTGLTDGSHTFEVRSTDASGNTYLTPANYTWVIDATSPSNTTDSNFINSGSTSTNSTTVTLTISATDNAGITGYYASENSTTPLSSVSGWTSVSSTASYSAGLTFTLNSGEGTKTVYVWFRDAAGNVSASASDTIILDTLPPDTSITNQLTNPSNSTSASFSFTSAETGTTFQCQLDYSGYSACTSPKSYTGLADGNHTFEVKATDLSGNTDSTPASYTWEIDVTAPTNTTNINFINSGAESTNTATVTLTISATDNTGITAYYASEASTIPSGSDPGWTSVSSTTSYSAGVTFTLNSSDGTKTVYVWFRDVAGNISSEANDIITLGSPPFAPTGMKTAVSDGQATISWDAVSNAASYNIYCSTTSGVTKSTGTQILNTISPYNHTGRANGTTYYYVVTAVNGFGESVESNQTSATPQTPIPLPKTGQTTCYDSSGSSGSVIACAGTGQDGDLQRGVAWPSPRFIDNGNGTVTDNLTGLDWTKDGNAPGPFSCSPAVIKTWQGALDYVSCLNANSYLGYSDWRLPNINELISLLHFGQADTATWLNTQNFNNVQPLYYWSSTSGSHNPGTALAVNMRNGYMVTDVKSSYYYVWPVRSGQVRLLGNSTISIPKTGQMTCYNSSGNVIACAGTGQDGDLQRGVAWPNPRFTDNGDGTVTDKRTGLDWTKNSNAPGPVACSPAVVKTWEGALDYVSCLNSNSYLGNTDWRLPNVNELYSLRYSGQSDTATWLNTQGFTNVQPSGYWSSTTVSAYSPGAWLLHMLYGEMSITNKTYYSLYYVWPVRSGQ